MTKEGHCAMLLFGGCGNGPQFTLMYGGEIVCVLCYDCILDIPDDKVAHHSILCNECGSTVSDIVDECTVCFPFDKKKPEVP